MLSALPWVRKVLRKLPGGSSHKVGFQQPSLLVYAITQLLPRTSQCKLAHYLQYSHCGSYITTTKECLPLYSLQKKLLKCHVISLWVSLFCTLDSTFSCNFCVVLSCRLHACHPRTERSLCFTCALPVLVDIPLGGVDQNMGTFSRRRLKLGYME
jgi:hypothetical protein